MVNMTKIREKPIHRNVGLFKAVLIQNMYNAYDF